MKKKKIDLNDVEEQNPNLWDEILKKVDVPTEEEVMDLLGHITTVENGWIVRKYKNGKIQKIKKYK